MVAGMKFLSKKGFNPQNLSNQKRVWEARHEAKREEDRIKERQIQLKNERDEEELDRARGEPVHLKFMYAPPPGMVGSGGKKDDDDGEDDDVKPPATVSSSGVTAASNSTDADDITKVQAGDDPAAAAFRRMLAAAAVGVVYDEDGIEVQNKQQQSTEDNRLGDGTVLQGTSVERDISKSKSGLSALEKSVGKRGQESLSLDEQVQRFPQLKNAPMARGMSGTDVGVSFKPLGAELRNVRCLACGVWGHSRGDRECAKSGWNPFAMTTKPATAAASGPPQQEQKTQDLTEKSRNNSARRDYSSSSTSDSEDSYREKKRRKKSKRRKKESKKKKSRRRSRSESPDRKRSRRSRSESPEQGRSRSRKSAKKSYHR